MDSMDIAAMSVQMSSSKLQMNTSVSVAKKAMDQQEAVAQGLLEMLPAEAGLGENINVTA